MLTRIKQTISDFYSIIIVCLLSLIKIVAFTPDSDTFFIIATGKYIIENKTIPKINPFVIHNNFSIVIQQWLFDAIIYKIYNAIGNIGLILYVFIAFVISIFLLYKYVNLFASNKKTAIITITIFSIIFFPFTTARPTGTTIIILLLHLIFLEKHYQTKNKKYLFAFPLLSILQVNLHSSFWIMLFILALPYLAPKRIPDMKRLYSEIHEYIKNNVWMFGIAILSALIGLINPYGINGILYLLNSYNNVTSELPIMELKNPTINSVFGIPCIVSMFIFVFFIFDRIKTNKYLRQEDVIKVYLAAGTIVLASMYQRNLWHLILGVSPMAVIVIDEMIIPLTKRQKQLISLTKNRPRKTTIAFCTIFLIVSISLSTLLFCLKKETDLDITPVKAVTYLNKLDKNKITLYNDFNSGAYLELHGYKVYMDARPELFTKDINKQKDVLREYIDVIKGNTDLQKFVDSYQFTHFVVDRPVMKTFLRYSDEYKEVITEEGYSLFERVDYVNQ